MKKIIASVNITIDNFVSAIDGSLAWHFPYWSDEMNRYALTQLNGTDTILLGRKTYEIMAKHWPAINNDFGCLMNSYNKLVCSNTLKMAEWENTNILSGNIHRQLQQLKSEQGKDIIIYGSITLIKALLKFELVDQLRLWVHPLTLGSGISLFDAHQHTLRLQESRHFDSGVVLLNYAV